MKQFIIKLLKVVSNILLLVSVLGLISSVVLMVLNNADVTIPWLTMERLGTATVYLGAIATTGGIAKVAGSSLRAMIEGNKTEVERQARLYDLKIAKVREESVDSTVALVEQVNMLTDAQKQTNTTNKQILEILLVSARRNLKSNLVSPEDKHAYKVFINNVKNKSEPNLENIYMTMVEQIEKEETKKDILTQVIESEK